MPVYRLQLIYVPGTPPRFTPLKTRHHSHSPMWRVAVHDLRHDLTPRALQALRVVAGDCISRQQQPRRERLALVVGALAAALRVGLGGVCLRVVTELAEPGLAGVTGRAL